MVVLNAEMSSNKINGLYSIDFKIKVIEYYLKNGGDSNFGLKSRTANHFSIDHKTVSRMLCNRDLIKQALRKLQKSGDFTLPDGRPVNHESVVGQFFLGSPPSKKIPDKTSNQVEESFSHSENSNVIEAPVIDLPEDPDFSLLKKTISSSSSSTSNYVKLLVTGTDEVRRILSNECDLIFECKVCRNLFRSVVNLLAHKRIYCQDDYADVRQLYTKDTSYGISSESSTVIVKPEESSDNVISSWNFGGGETRGRSTKIDQIASNLAGAKLKSRRKPDDRLSSSTDQGSSKFHSELERVNDRRRATNRDCAVILQDISHSSAAVYQTLVTNPKENKDANKPETRMKQAIQKHIYEEKKETVHLKPAAAPADSGDEDWFTEDGPLIDKSPPLNAPLAESSSDLQYDCPSCDKSFSNKTNRTLHVQEEHGVERSVYTCPICSVLFLSIRDCVRHLARVHNKKKHQRERLKVVIGNRVKRRVLTAKEIEKITNSRSVDGDFPNSLPHGSSTPPLKKPLVLDPKTLDHQCVKCGQIFVNNCGLSSHLIHCKFQSDKNGQSLQPEKKIGIQIRKDYAKEPPTSPTPVLPPKETCYTADLAKLNIDPKILKGIEEFCDISRLYCKPCGRSYNTITTLKRHAAQHLEWTRFSCAKCSFANYERYVVNQHIVSEHKCKANQADKFVQKEDLLGNLKLDIVHKSIEVKRDKWDYLSNGHNASISESSTSIESEDSLSMRSECDNQDVENANVAYRELIENADLEVETKLQKSNSLQDFTKSTTDNSKTNDSDSKLERPQRERKVVEKKDFVYESTLRSSPILSRPDEDLKSNVISLRVRNISSISLPNDRSGKRSASSTPSEPPRKKINSSSIKDEQSPIEAKPSNYPPSSLSEDSRKNASLVVTGNVTNFVKINKARIPDSPQLKHNLSNIAKSSLQPQTINTSKIIKIEKKDAPELSKLDSSQSSSESKNVTKVSTTKIISTKPVTTLSQSKNIIPTVAAIKSIHIPPSIVSTTVSLSKCDTSTSVAASTVQPNNNSSEVKETKKSDIKTANVSKLVNINPKPLSLLKDGKSPQIRIKIGKESEIAVGDLSKIYKDTLVTVKDVEKKNTSISK